VTDRQDGQTYLSTAQSAYAWHRAVIKPTAVIVVGLGSLTLAGNR